MKYRLIFLTLLSFAASGLSAQTESSSGNTENPLTYIMSGILVGGIVGVLFFMAIRKLSFTEEEKRKETAFTKLIAKLSKAVPVENEKDIMLDHDFDGIRELDNTIPPWFNILFYGTVVIAILYMLNYHVFKLSPLSAEEYKEEMKIAAAERDELIRTGAFINENTVKLLNDEATLNEGKVIFTNNCAVCHGPGAGGIIGPNLTDEYWIHGGGIKNVFSIIKYGVPIKGMISWQNQLNPKQMQAAANYILSLKGSSPVNPKAPEGTIYIDSVSINADTNKNAK
ncbi:hypothetical protein BH10BAC5_BH10BAC5_26090 [soil metagenome]